MQVRARNNHYRDIVRGLRLEKKHAMDVLTAYHHTFWMGDLNYRYAVLLCTAMRASICTGGTLITDMLLRGAWLHVYCLPYVCVLLHGMLLGEMCVLLGDLASAEEAVPGAIDHVLLFMVTCMILVCLPFEGHHFTTARPPRVVFALLPCCRLDYGGQATNPTETPLPADFDALCEEIAAERCVVFVLHRDLLPSALRSSQSCAFSYPAGEGCAGLGRCGGSGS